ncbi:MAG: FmdE family protein [Candidatus Latescibacterota bacterium]
MSDESQPPFSAVAAFHGHVCPGLAMGYRMALEAMRSLQVARSDDEELVAVVENDACGVDALQYLTGCTFGKGNLVFRDYGKQVYTLFHRPTGRAVRVTTVEDPGGRARRTAQGEDREQWIEWLLGAPAALVVKAESVDRVPPPTARIRRSVPCAACGERVMETRARVWEGQTCCLPCFEAAQARAEG